ncbi:hypothetical protein G4Q83_00245 [Xanthomonas theicola]|nr:hypothetical protein G4Q83_00245 [Xanthomonas theicola]
MRLMLGTKPCAAKVLPKSPLAYWAPRSEWNSTPAPTGATDQALRKACWTSVSGRRSDKL